MSEFDALESYIADNGADFRPALEADERQEAGGHDLLLQEGLACKRPVAYNTSSLIVVPLAFLIQCLEAVFDPEACILHSIGYARIGGELCGMRCLVNRPDFHAHLRPIEKPDNLNITAFPTLLDFVVPILHYERLGLGAWANHSQEAVVRGTRALRSNSFDKQLSKVTWSHGGPELARALLPASDNLSTAYDGVSPFIRGVCGFGIFRH